MEKAKSWVDAPKSFSKVIWAVITGTALTSQLLLSGCSSNSSNIERYTQENGITYRINSDGSETEMPADSEESNSWPTDEEWEEAGK